MDQCVASKYIVFCKKYSYIKIIRTRVFLFFITLGVAYNNFEKSTAELAELIEDIKNNPKRYVNFSLLGSGSKNFKKNQDN